MNESAILAPTLIQLALLLVALSAVYSAYMLLVIGAVMARRRHLGQLNGLPIEAPEVGPARYDWPREHPLAGARLYPAPTDAG